ncbi:hypothetical protein HYH03_012978 [Edaphochlamys debaryana]|uniref:Rad60/SUMO-like domain-containing protein n=1 Tax=Edaphochlamys debaryana TaxID=47281 RepID=A0A836BUY1_9CHLO|nr:hypothetical protein HYH03_012978 [Edaphochlamys debaryana]|eukprot:KAG2488473.1 hypothetical protein HYH03_012978 [Edaphochlamys debaryana]
MSDLWDYNDDDVDVDAVEWAPPPAESPAVPPDDEEDSEEAGGKKRRGRKPTAKAAAAKGAGRGGGRGGRKRRASPPKPGPVQQPRLTLDSDDDEEFIMLDNSDDEGILLPDNAKPGPSAAANGAARPAPPVPEPGPSGRGAALASLNPATQQSLAREQELLRKWQQVEELPSIDPIEPLEPDLDQGLLLRRPPRPPPRPKPTADAGAGAGPSRAGNGSSGGGAGPGSRAAAEEPAPAPAPAPAAPAPEADNAPRVMVVMTWKSGKQSMRIRRSDPLSKLIDSFRKFAADKKLTSQPQKIRFKFDGDDLQGSSTADDLDLDDADQIDVVLPAA